jgi:dehydrogenase/reductase SDR family protein 12
MVCRDRTAGEEARGRIISDSGNSEVYLHLCDCSVFSSVRGLATELLGSLPRVDVLVNNAGCLPTTRNTTSEGNEVIIATALGGTMLLTDLLLPLLRKSALVPIALDDATTTTTATSSNTIWTGGRVINVSSGGGYNVHANLVDLNLDGPKSPPYDGTLFYAYAKRAQMELTKVWAKKLIAASTGPPSPGSSASDATAAVVTPLVAVHCMHPGWASTEGLKVAMSDFHDSRKDTLRSAEQGADTIIYLSCAASAGPRAPPPVPYAGGEFWFDREIVPTDFPLARTSSTDEEREQLWDIAAKFVGGLKNI